MSLWISLEQNGQPVAVPPHQEGNIPDLGRTEDAVLSVSFNLQVFFRPLGLLWKRDIDGRRAGDCCERLRRLAGRLGDQPRNPFDPWPGNAGHVLTVLLHWAELHPNAVFRVR